MTAAEQPAAGHPPAGYGAAVGPALLGIVVEYQPEPPTEPLDFWPADDQHTGRGVYLGLHPDGGAIDLALTGPVAACTCGNCTEPSIGFALPVQVARELIVQLGVLVDQVDDAEEDTADDRDQPADPEHDSHVDGDGCTGPVHDDDQETLHFAEESEYQEHDERACARNTGDCACDY